MHHGFRIVEDMIDGLSAYLSQQNMQSLTDLRGRAISSFKEWGDLDLDYRVVAHIDESKCIGCNKCYVACLDGSHQCIYLPGMSRPHAQASGHTRAPAQEFFNRLSHQTKPMVDEDECVGCNLCQLVCPVADCITMVEQKVSGTHLSWKEKMHT